MKIGRGDVQHLNQLLAYFKCVNAFINSSNLTDGYCDFSGALEI